MKKIIYLVQRFRPSMEATSKEVDNLYGHFKKISMIHDLHIDGIQNFKFSKNLISYHFIFYPIFFLFLRLLSLKRILHVYTSLLDTPYLPFLSKKRMILTSTNYFSKERIKKRIKYLKKVKKIIVESDIQKKELVSLGIKEEKLALIYPSVDVEKFKYEKTKGKFKILNATCPSKLKDFEKRGIFLLLNCDKHLKDTTLNLAWRQGQHFIDKTIKNKKFDSIVIKHRIIKDMNQEYAKNHCTIIPYTKFDEYLKLMPLSAIESLAAGKPILVSSQTGMAEIVRKEKCGVIFNPDIRSLLAAIKDLKKNYMIYQKNCQKTVNKYFLKRVFIKKYTKIYKDLK
ncbi:MAG: glycosyltransferase [Nanoarchaeota archaeon]